MSKFTRYRVFSAVVENGSLASAAESLNMSPSSVSKQLSKLEEGLGVDLIDRTTHTLVVTDSGMDFYQRVKSILNEVENAEEWIQQKETTLQGVLTLSIPQMLLKTPLLSLLAEFNHTHPEIRFDIRVSNKFDDLIERRVDFAFRVGPLKDSQYVAIPLAKLNVVFCASPGYVSKHGKLPLRKLLEEHHIIIPGFMSAASVHQLASLGASSQSKSIQCHTSDDALTIDEMARSGLGVCATFDISVHNAIQSGGLVRLPTSAKLPKQDLNMVFYKRQHMPSKNQAFKDFIKCRLPEALAKSV